jgi:nucleoside-diphosphate-sugar epimerase
MSKILLTGATGFLGSHILASLVDNFHYDVVILKRTTSDTFRIKKLLDSPKIKIYNADEINLEKIFDENSIEIIIHCATNYGRNNENSLNIIQSNLVLPLSILQLAVDHGTKLFINTDTIIDKNISHYSLSKSHFLDWLKSYSDHIKCVNLSLEHFYGAFDNRTKFTTYIISSFLNNVKELDLTAGEQKRYFIYIDDVVNAFLTILKSQNLLVDNFHNFDVSTEDNIKLKDFVLMVKSLTGNRTTKVNFGKIPYRSNEVMEFRTDISNLKRLGWSPVVELEEGLIKTIRQEIKL